MPGRYFEIIVSGRQLATFIGVVAALILGGFGLGVVVGLQQPASVPEPSMVAEAPGLSVPLPTPVFEPFPSPAPVATASVLPVEVVPSPTTPPPTLAPTLVPTVTPVAPVEARRSPVVPPAAGRWVQVAALSKRDQADGVRTRVMAAGFTAAQVMVLPASAGKYRVRLGPFPDEESAKRVAGRLKAGDFPGAFVVRE